MNVMPLHAITGMLFIMTPNTVQQKTPNEKSTYIGSDRPATCLVRIILTTCGRNAIVVHVAAMLDISVTIILLSLETEYQRIDYQYQYADDKFLRVARMRIPHPSRHHQQKRSRHRNDLIHSKFHDLTFLNFSGPEIFRVTRLRLFKVWGEHMGWGCSPARIQ
jgi:hypothetical protein